MCAECSHLLWIAVLRFGRCVDVLYGSLKVIHYNDFTIRLTLTMSKVCQSLFLFVDHFMWMARAGILGDVNIRKLSLQANKYWLLSVIMNLCRDFYEIMRLWDLHQAASRSGISSRPLPARVRSGRDLATLALHSYSLMLDHRNVLVDTVKNICDFFIPLTALGYTNLTPRAVGLLGAISSMAGILALVAPSAKLVPV